MKALKRLEKIRGTWFLIIISFVFFILRLPSFFEPDWYGDEGIYQVLGVAMNHGRLLYRDIFDNKPPLLYFLYSIVNSDQFSIRFLSFLAGLLAVFCFYFIVRKFLKSEKSVFLTTGIFAFLFGIPLIEGNIANSENFMIPLALLSSVLIFKALEEKSENRKLIFILLSGLALGISFLFKIVAVFDFAAFFVFLGFWKFEKLSNLINKSFLISEIKHLIFLVLGFSAPIVFVTGIFILNGAFSDFLRATFFSNIGYVGYGNKFIIPQGFLILKLIMLGIFVLFVFWKKKKFGDFATFVLLWLGFSLFNAFFSQRPYTHYVLVLLPAFVLLLGLVLENSKYKIFYCVIFLVTFFLAATNFWYFGKTVFYYQNFISFISNHESVYGYQKFFDNTTPRDYEIADYVNLRTGSKDNIFIWGNNAQVYKLTNKLPPEKYIVAYHILNYEDGISLVGRALLKTTPKFIIVMPNVSSYPFSLTKYSLQINIDGALIYEKLF